MKLMEKILSKENLAIAIKKVKKNKGAPGVDRMTVHEIEYWFEQYQDELITKIMNKQYRPMPVKRVYIPKSNGYRSYHIVFELPLDLAGEIKPIFVEIQIRTIAMDFWSNLEHEMRYKKNIKNQQLIRFRT